MVSWWPGGRTPTRWGQRRGQLRLSANRVWRMLRRHGLPSRAKYYGLVAGYAAH
jgi:hypothetical protein